MKTRLNEIITKRGLERRKIAEDLQIERRTLDNYINENTLMNSDIIKKMAEYLNVSTDYLLGVDELSNEFLNEKIDTICNELKELVYHLNKRS
ncbi:MAG: helix-turn-helix domain-containing protein [Anaeroplasmataceae bacterium]|nr:helix-turn-helix domain-containing protein [Anaeroplasmataceae bacterium]